LDQLIDEEETLTQEDLHKDLASLRTAAMDSNKILRGMLETIQPETTPVLTNLLCEYARKVSQRTKFKIDFVIQGIPLAISPEIGQTVFFAFQELLSNVEKYAAASQVDVILNWGDDKLEMTVSDNGKGFDLRTINHKQHFGLEIMQERISRVSGQMNLVTAADKGTKVTISLPSPYQEKVNPIISKG
jgi:signal transduction histidine kinase